MSDTTAAPVATTAGSTPATEPVTTTPATSTPAPTTTPVATEVKEETKAPVTDEPNYDWVPKKFLKDGKPDFENLAKSYTSLEKRWGSRSLAPEVLDEYSFEGKLQYDPEISKTFKEKAQKAGLSTEQYKFVMSEYEEMVSQFSHTPERAEKALKEAWGDQFDMNMQNAIRAYEVYVPSNISIEEIGNNPAVLAILARVGAELREDTSPVKSATSSVGTSKEDIHKIMRDPTYWRDKTKQALVTEWYQKNAGK